MHMDSCPVLVEWGVVVRGAVEGRPAADQRPARIVAKSAMLRRSIARSSARWSTLMSGIEPGVVPIDAVLDEHWCELAHQIIGHARRVHDLGGDPPRFGGAGGGRQA
jgi:hypothetical protein